MLAVLAASIALILGAAIANIATKEVLLSGLGRESQYAFYAADTAAECAQYWDYRYGYFDPTAPIPASPPISCSQKTFTVSESPSGVRPVDTAAKITTLDEYTASFQFEPEAGKTCANVVVLKCRCDVSTNSGGCIDDGVCSPSACTTPNSDCSNVTYQTLVHADGYNTACSAIATTPTALERSIDLNY